MDKIKTLLYIARQLYLNTHENIFKFVNLVYDSFSEIGFNIKAPKHTSIFMYFFKKQILIIYLQTCS